MKKSKFIAVLASVLVLTSCASVGIKQEVYNKKIHTVNIGMTKSEFIQLFPSAIPRGAKKYKHGVIEVFEVSVENYSFYPTGNDSRNIWTGKEGAPQWFYFLKNELIQYGKPNDWPANPNEIIEIRNR